LPLPLVLGDGGIEDGSPLECIAQRALEHGSKLRALFRGGELAEHVPGMGMLERIGDEGNMARGKLHCDARDQLKGTHAIAARRAQLAQEGDGTCDIGERDERRRARTDLRR
jgi:hypothetical protein